MNLRREIKIEKHSVGDGLPCFIVAEAGGNHNLVLEQALKLIDIAADAGVDAVKFSLSRAKTMYPPNAGYAEYLGMKTPIYEMIKRREMPFEWIPELMNYSREKGLVFLCSSFDDETTDVLAKYDIDAFKIASYEATHQPLLRYVARKGKPIIMSVGVTLLDEIKESIEVILSEGNDQLILMHCIGSYPAPVEDTNLKMIQMLKEEFGCPVGISDHSRNPTLVPSCAATLGANIIEKHFTISNLLPGADHPFAIEPDELKKLVEFVRMAQRALGDSEKLIAPSEKELYNFARRTIFATKKIKRGDTFTTSNTAILRCGQHKPGLPPKAYENLIGSKVKKEIGANQPVNQVDV